VAFLKFSALRLGLVVVFFLICLWLGLGIIYSALAAAILAWCVTYLLFRQLRDDAAATLQRRIGSGTPHRGRTELQDAEAEDGYQPRE
jgi:hypothetical protein